MNAVVYCCPKNTDQFGAFALGFKARMVPSTVLQPVKEADLHIIGGLQFGSLQLLKQVRERALPYVFFDRAYFGGGPGSGVLRVTRGAYQQHWVKRRVFDLPSAPSRGPRVTMKPWRHRGTHVLLVPPSAAVCDLFGLGDWGAQMEAQLRAQTDRPIHVSRKGDSQPLEQRLSDCHCVVTWTSNVAVEAVLAGVPVWCAPESAASPVAFFSDDDFLGLANPRMSDRGEWATSLAWSQFTLAEIRSGFARDVVMQEAACTA